MTAETLTDDVADAPAGTAGPDLHAHGDRQVPPGAVDLAVNVLPGPPDWLRHRLATVDLAAYPDPAPTRAAAAARHGVPPDHCLLTNGAAEAFWLVAQALRPRLAACVHPSFTAPEAALRSAGVPVTRVLRRPEDDFALDPARVPDEADLVVLGRPDNPTGRYDDLAVLRALARPGRVVLVDEAFADFLPDGGEAAGVARLGIPGVLCLRSLTKVWGLAGLRVGYVLGAPDLLARLDAVRQPWPVSSPAIAAVALLSGPPRGEAEAERRRRALAVGAARAELMAGLAPLVGDGSLRVWTSPANYLLLRGPAGLRDRLLRHGLALRRAETFPGLDDSFARAAVSLDPAVRRTLVSALAAEVGASCAGRTAEGGGVRHVADPIRGRTPPVSAAEAGTPAEQQAPSPRRTLVIGGARSGKSRHAETMLAGHDEVLYVATGPVPDGADADWADRVARHRRDRPATWTTLETRDVAAAIGDAEAPVLVDCLATWLAATLDEVGAWSEDPGRAWEGRLEAEVDRLLDAWAAADVPVVAVTNEVGCGVVPGTRSGALFRDALGRLNQRVAAGSDDVRLVVAGRVHHLPEEGPR
jgi:histidinol-phosphate/aromatic aminotransferase/cobyric acid decarboxylase-like protein/adenosyl cobinamide kinase/adenosyl cobinamide phosphate guanylyltransferase